MLLRTVMLCKQLRREVTPVRIVPKLNLKHSHNQSLNLKKRSNLHQNKFNNNNNSPSKLKNSQRNRRKSQNLRKFRPHLSSNRSILLPTESTFWKGRAPRLTVLSKKLKSVSSLKRVESLHLGMRTTNLKKRRLKLTEWSKMEQSQLMFKPRVHLLIMRVLSIPIKSLKVNTEKEITKETYIWKSLHELLFKNDSIYLSCCKF